MNAVPSPDYVSIGKIIKPHGLKGALKMKLFVNDVEVVRIPGRFYLYHPDSGETRKVTIDELTESGRGLIVRFSGFDFTTAEMVRGYHLVVHKKELPRLGDGEYYYFQLLECRVFTQNGEIVGEVVDIIETGSNDVLVVQKGRPGFDLTEELVPVTKEYVLAMDLVNSSIVVKTLDYGEEKTDENQRSDDLS